jgi:DUF1680 family protein
MRRLMPLTLNNVKLEDPFWSPRQNLVREVVIPYQWAALNDHIPGVEPSHTIQNFRIAAGESDGEYYGMVFQDSDLYKWLEAVAYTLSIREDQELEQKADEAIDLIARAQRPDGYLNTYYTLVKPDQRWTNLRDDHELYCAGHLIEAAVAYWQATGKRKILDVACRFADYIDSVFGRDSGKKRGYPGHQEIELALLKLYRVTRDKKYLNLARYFVEERGQQPHYFQLEAEQRRDTRKYEYEYSQSHLPIREQIEAVGHAVRAMYYYSAVADIAMECDDQSLLDACKRLWRNVVQQKMYVTGGIGSSADNGEAFTVNYDLPNDTAYAETCASIGLVFWAHRMLQAEPKREYADVMERALYNGILSGMSLDGKSYFYVNPLEVWPDACDYRSDMRTVKYVRQGWFGCACCPPNLARLIASLGQYVYASHAEKREIYVHLYIGSKADVQLGDQRVTLEQESGLPWHGSVRLKINADQPTLFTLKLRIPSWCTDPILKVNGEVLESTSSFEDGYFTLERVWSGNDEIDLQLPMQVKRIRSNPLVRENAGRVALQYGPIVYCLEEVDNGPNLRDISLPRRSQLSARYVDDLLGGVILIEGSGFRTDPTTVGERLYTDQEPRRIPCKITAVPYFAWANRSPGEMTVWIREE